MMKSFFKKLAFVMALAMVVTMAAPAGTAALAADFYIADEANKKAETFKLEIGEKEDFSFKNALDHKNYTWTWESSDKTVATVDKSGIVTGVADGVATITVKGGDKYAASVVVTVGKGNPSSGYEVVQKTVGVVDVLFNGAHKFTTADVRLEYVVDGGWVVEWPLKEVKEIDGGFSVEPYVEFEDGSTYIMYVGAKDKGTEFTTTFGIPTHLEVHYKYKGVEDGDIKINLDDADENEDVELFVKFFSGTVDVSSLHEQENVEYFFETSASDEEATCADNTITFNAANVAVNVLAEYIYENEELELETPIRSAKAKAVVSKALPEYKIVKMVRWTIVDKSKVTTYDKIVWDKHEIRANDDAAGEYVVVVEFEDSYGNTIITDSSFLGTDEDVIAKYAEKGIYGHDDSDYTFAAKEYSFAFTSANPSKMLIGATDASLTTYTEANVAVIVGLYCSDDENKAIKDEETGLVRNATAFRVEVTKERKVDSIEFSPATVVLPSEVLSGNSVAEYGKKSVTIVVKDQYGDPWTESDITLKVTPDKDQKVGLGIDGDIVYSATAKKVTIDLLGSHFYDELKPASKKIKSTNITFTAKVGSDEASAKLNIGVLNVKETKNGVSQFAKTSDKLTVKNATLDVHQTDVSKIKVSTTVELAQSIKDVAVGRDTTVALYDRTATYNKTNTSDDARFIEVLKPNGDPLGVDANGLGFTAGANGVFNLVASDYVYNEDLDANETVFLESGKYTVNVYAVNGFDSKDSNKAKIDVKKPVFTTTVEIKNSSKDVVFEQLVKNVITTDDEINYDLVSILDEILVVSVNGKEWDFEAEDIVAIYGRYNEDAGYVIVTKVDFMVPVNAPDGTPLANVYYTTTAEVNEAIELDGITFVGGFDDGVYSEDFDSEEE